MNVVIEGMDFAGKSTVCDEIAALLRARGLQVHRSTTSLSPGKIPDLIKAVHQAEHIPDLVRSVLFHLAYLADLPTRIDVRRRAAVVLQESYVCRVWAYDLVRHRRCLAYAARRLATRLHQRVDLAVLLRCPYPQRRERYLAGGLVSPRDERRFAVDQRVQQDQLERALTDTTARLGYHIVDTDTDSTDRIARQLVDVILVARSQGAT
jgi:thymidylate kinase